MNITYKWVSVMNFGFFGTHVAVSTFNIKSVLLKSASTISTIVSDLGVPP